MANLTEILGKMRANPALKAIERLEVEDGTEQ